MNIDTAKNLEAAATLGRNDRAGFEVEYDAWLAKDEIDGAPDYTVHRKDLTATLEAVLGPQDTQRPSAVAPASKNRTAGSCPTRSPQKSARSAVPTPRRSVHSPSDAVEEMPPQLSVGAAFLCAGSDGERYFFGSLVPSFREDCQEVQEEGEVVVSDLGVFVVPDAPQFGFGVEGVLGDLFEGFLALVCVEELACDDDSSGCLVIDGVACGPEPLVELHAGGFVPGEGFYDAPGALAS